MKLLSLLLIGLLASAAPLQSAIAPEKRAEIEKMLSLTGTTKMMDQVMTQMIGQMKTGMPGAPAGYWEKFSAKIKSEDLLEMIIPLYDKYYTLEDLQAVNLFYSSPGGQKFLSSLPQITAESMKVGQAWGEKIARQAQEEIAAQKSPAAASSPTPTR